ncbi:SMC-Scp complex subunit ScpB, partial [Candidatus Woesearchaeota archaeon CG10_big_fil_rev_8_21_14_0_10_47_5]
MDDTQQDPATAAEVKTGSAEQELRKQIEAMLFSAGRKMDVEELARLCNMKDHGIIKRELEELKKAYKASGSALMFIEEGNSWKLTVREPFLPLVQRIVAETELERSVMETLAVIAWKMPVLQSEIVDTRGSKAYEHIKELMEQGFLTKERKGRSYRIKLSQRFFDYFDLESIEAIKKSFLEHGDADEIKKLEEDIELKEAQIGEARRLEEEMKEEREEERLRGGQEELIEENIQDKKKELVKDIKELAKNS